MMQFSRIRLTNWRNFGSVDVRLQNRTFLIGANASGKSNFLDVFRFLRDLALPSGGGFQQAVMSRGGVSTVRYINARHPQTNIVIDVELSDDGKSLWRYRIEFNQEGVHPIIREEKVWRDGEVIVSRPDKQDEQDKTRLKQTHLEQTFANFEFRQIAEFFQTISYSHIVPQLVRDSERYVGHQNDPFGGDFLEQMATVNKGSRLSRLKRIQTALKQAIPQLSELEWVRDNQGIPHLRGRYHSGAWQQESDFSDGTLRLIGLLWSLQDGEGPLLLEEPELSLHPGVVRYLSQMIFSVLRQRKKAMRQLIISTHSREMINAEGVGADEVLLFQVADAGTKVIVGADEENILQELNAGMTMADVVMSRTEPPELYQLPLWND
jgi:predicted ATPase